MDTSNTYFANAEVAYRTNQVREELKSVRRRRRAERDRVPAVRRPLDDDLAS
ncbi:hypothetical protein [Nocardioides jensenii]|uniref:hypothetical protein n=1 Tax=Nocardioides jensenii TaxID=1843 RepID=UPI0012FC98B0|nr:hypothetical protein [Nocardioides jensenii]